MNQSNPGWEVWELGSENHIVPVNDWMVHARSRRCPCLPFIDEELNPPVVIHHSADLREYSEPDHIPGLYEGERN